MPIYSYTCRFCSETTDHYAEDPDSRARWVKCQECGRAAVFDFAATARGIGTPSPKWATGHRSKAMGVHPSQAESEEKALRAATGYSQIEVCRKTGDVITYSERQKQACAKANGMIDRDGGYTA